MTIEEKISMFIEEMDYLNNEHVLGMFFYGSFLTGYNNPDSDIDLHIIFDDSNPLHLIRGNKIIDNTKIEYFEKPISDIYLSVENDFNRQDNALLSIIGKSVIVFDKKGDLKKLQEHTLNRFSNPLPRMDNEEAREQVSIIDNRMEKLKRYALKDDPYFNHLYHLTIEKVRKFYHRVYGLPKLQTSKVFRVYTDQKYRESFYKERIPEENFVKLYLYAVTVEGITKSERYSLVEKLYELARKDIKLYESSNISDYRILIKSRNMIPYNEANNELHNEESKKQELRKRLIKTLDNIRSQKSHRENK